MPEILTPDLCVIGAGAGGIAATEAARALEADVVVVDRRGAAAGQGGGALAAAAFLECARRAHAIRTSPSFGIAAVEPKVDFAAVREHVHAAVAAAAPGRSAEHLAALGAKVVRGQGRFADAQTLAVGETLVRARRFVIATGAMPVLPAIAGLETVPFFTTETVFENARRVTHIVIVGAGATGAELGQAFRRLGADVTLIEAELPLREADPELADVALRRLQEEGVLIRTGTSVPSVAPREGGGVVVTIRTPDGEETISASHLCVATGRAPSLDLDLDRAGVRRSKTDPARLALDEELRTTNRRIHAIGDAAGGLQTAQRAAYDGRLAARAALLALGERHRPENVPVCFHTDPGIAWVGLDEAAARKARGDRFRVTRLPFAENDRARAARATYGLVKLVTTPRGRILGAGVVGPDAGELAALFSLAISAGLSLDHLVRMDAPYPALAGIVPRLAAEAMRGRPPSATDRALRSLARRLP